MSLSANVSRFFFGSACLACGEGDGVLDPWLCKDCKRQLASESAGIYTADDAFSFYVMGTVSRKLIHALKYGSMPGMALYLVKNSGTALEEFKEWLPRYERLFFVPVPLHHSRYRERGYNQTEKISQALAAACGGRVLNLLKRRSFSVSQTKLSSEERQANVAGAFVVRANARPEPGDLFVVVDDVFTTGATTGACLYALRQAGFENAKVCTMLYESPLSARADYAADCGLEWRF